MIAQVWNFSPVCGCRQSHSFANPFRILFERSIQSYSSKNWGAREKSVSMPHSACFCSLFAHGESIFWSFLQFAVATRAVALQAPSTYTLKGVCRVTAWTMEVRVKKPHLCFILHGFAPCLPWWERKFGTLLQFAVAARAVAMQTPSTYYLKGDCRVTARTIEVRMINHCKRVILHGFAPCLPWWERKFGTFHQFAVAARAVAKQIPSTYYLKGVWRVTARRIDLRVKNLCKRVIRHVFAPCLRMTRASFELFSSLRLPAEP